MNSMKSLKKNIIFTLLLLFPFITCCACGNGGDTLANGIVARVSGRGEGVLQQIVVPPMPKEASFAGEKMPLENFDVYESLQREIITITHWHGSLIYIMQLAGRHKPVVEKILKEEGLHPDFFYLCVAESSLQPATSPANAKGYWQFLASTGKEYGLEINSQVDERYNWEKSTRAACKYLKKAFEKYGTWTLAAASYQHWNGQCGFKDWISVHKELLRHAIAY